VFTAHLKGRKHKRNAKRLALSSTGSQSGRDDNYPVALTEERIFQYAELLRSLVNDTMVYLQNKQTRTHEEMAADLEEENMESLLSDEDEEEDSVISNPLNLPLGWDGKPIPYWLYKLHGLNQEFKCEICGNYTYRGPRAFRRHFREWRHAYGMRCLGIPNTDHFFNITTFKDAIALHQKLVAHMKARDFKAEEEEEFEDDEGHVFNKKTYDDLKRQGLI
jgi:splicing factor 3A subunit 3